MPVSMTQKLLKQEEVWIQYADIVINAPIQEQRQDSKKFKFEELIQEEFKET